jgi:hypothetical protein
MRADQNSPSPLEVVDSHQPAPRQTSPWRRWILGAIFGLVAALACVVFWPASPVDLRKVDPEGLALREARAWRAYYEERYATLFWQVFQVAYSEYGFSLRDSVRLSVHAALAAVDFRHSNETEDMAQALGQMEHYYQIISGGSRQPFDDRAVARLELQWWQMRREKLPPEEWSQTIAQQCELIYRIPAVDFLPSVRLRVAAMVLRDSHRQEVMSDEDWLSIQDLLMESAKRFRNVLTTASGQTVAEVVPSGGG